MLVFELSHLTSLGRDKFKACQAFYRCFGNDLNNSIKPEYFMILQDLYTVNPLYNDTVCSRLSLALQ